MCIRDSISTESFTTFNTKDATVWIDPLDGTSDFVKGNLPAVTVLIGLTINDKSRMGIVHQVWNKDDQSVGKTVFGTGEHGAFIVPYNKDCTGEESLAREKQYMEPFDHTAAAAEGHEIRVAASLMHFSEQMKTIIESLDPVKIVRLGGAGNKAVHIALNEVDTYMHPSPGLRYWDLCAPESLAKAMGGYAENLY